LLATIAAHHVSKAQLWVISLLVATAIAKTIALQVLVTYLPITPPVCLTAVLALQTLPRPVPAQAHLSAAPSSATLKLILANLHALLLPPRATTLLAVTAKMMMSASPTHVIPLELIRAHPTVLVLAQSTCLIIANAQAQVNVSPISVIQTFKLACPHALCLAPRHILLAVTAKLMISAPLAHVIPLELICAHPTVQEQATSLIPVRAPAHLSATLNTVTLIQIPACHLVPSLSQLVHIPMVVTVR
jgi:hypothetical protein